MFLLVRALTTAESLGRDLEPTFNIATYVQPFAEQLVLERYDSMSAVSTLPYK
jgi:predicted unusual protein kinase regulating ubiquinone biosynthesis (AarF/ABC1/UbiB family)